MACEDQGVFTRLLVEPGDPTHTFDANSERHEFLYEDIAKYGRIIGGNGIRGTRSSPVERTRAGAYYVYGPLVMNVSPGEFVNWLPRILGAAASGTTFALDEDLPAFGLMIDRGADIFQYNGCKINRAVIRGRSPQLAEEGEPDLLTMQLDIIGLSEQNDVSWPVSPPSLSTNANIAPYVFSDSASGVTLAGSTRQIEQFVLVVDNHLQARFTNSLTAYKICPRDRTVQFRCAVPYETGVAGLYGQSTAGATGSLVFTNGNMSTTFTFATLQVPDRTPTVPGKRGLSLVLDHTSRMSGSTRELVVTNDSTA